MAVAIEFISLIVPIEKIRNIYPGGWETCLEDHRALIGGRVWFDEHLFRDGVMGPPDMRVLLDEWEARGFQGMRKIDGEMQWIDCCVVDQFSGPTLPCEWIETGGDDLSVYLKGTEPGDVIGREA